MRPRTCVHRVAYGDDLQICSDSYDIEYSVGNVAPKAGAVHDFARIIGESQPRK